MEIRNGVFCFNRGNPEVSLEDWASNLTAYKTSLKMFPPNNIVYIPWRCLFISP